MCSPVEETEGTRRAWPGQRGEWFLACLYLFAFCSQFKPSEPYLVDYFIEAKGISNHEVYQSIYCLFVYARLPSVMLAGLLSEVDCCGSRGVLAVGATCGLVTVLLTRFGESLVAQQAAQFTVAAAFASRITLPALAFSLTLPSQFQQSVHSLKAVILLSNFCSAVLGELLRDYAQVPLTVLFDISMLGQAFSLFFALVLLSEQRPEQAFKAGAAALEPAVVQKQPHRTWSSRLSHLKAPLMDLWLSLWLRGVMWWTAWALAMNPVHGLMMNYWQSFIRAKHIRSDHNGFFLASIYLIAAMLTVISGRSEPFRGFTSLLVIGSLIGAGVLLCHVVSESRQLPIYGCLLVYQCLFEVTTAVATFQVGVEVTTATGASTSKALHGAAVRQADPAL